MRYNIEKGDIFECLKDYVMDNEEISYTEGKQYTSHHDSCITDNQLDDRHDMDGQGDFFKYFKLVAKVN